MNNENSDSIINIHKNIGANIRHLRKKSNLTIEQLSEIVKIAPGFLGLIERGERGTSLQNLCRIANIFDITIDDMINKNLSSVEGKEETCDRKYRASSVLMNSLNSQEEEFICDVIKRYIKLKETFNNFVN